jgi:hypothetical protein
MSYLESSNSQRQKVEWRFPGAGGRKEGKSLLGKYGVSVWDDPF